MKGILVLFLVVGAYGKPTIFTNYDDHRWSLVKDGEGKMHVYDNSPVELEIEIEPTFDPINDMFFLLFTRDNPNVGHRINIFDEASLRASHWRINGSVRILIHGWTTSANAVENIRTREELLIHADHNVVVVDWSVGAGAANYITARNRVGPAGEVVGQFIDWLTRIGYTHPSRIHIIGHSLGSHVAGHSGKNTQSGRIAVIFGTDPAGPLFNVGNPDRLDSSDAVYTEAIHTNAGTLGFDSPITHAAFYPNWGGPQQPGCGIDLGGSCAHARGPAFYWESINSSLFVSRQCASYDEIVARNCPGTGVTAIMGGDYAKDISGVFFLQTNSEPPFAMG